MEDLTDGERFLISLLYARGGKGRIAEPVNGRVILAKLLFLLWKNPLTHPLLEEVHFEPYDYGPWSDWIDVSLDELALRGYVTQEPGQATRISLTPKGTQEGRQLFQSLDAERRAIVEDVKVNFGSLSTDALLERVYAAYPDYATESKWRKRS
jgi:uncharacterized protein YwgA